MELCMVYLIIFFVLVMLLCPVSSTVHGQCSLVPRRLIYERNLIDFIKIETTWERIIRCWSEALSLFAALRGMESIYCFSKDCKLHMLVLLYLSWQFRCYRSSSFVASVTISSSIQSNTIFAWLVNQDWCLIWLFIQTIIIVIYKRQILDWFIVTVKTALIAYFVCDGIFISYKGTIFSTFFVFILNHQNLWQCRAKYKWRSGSIYSYW